jgi:ADP-ribose pyrophosphatase YjhB (NUDIX family)
VKRYSHCPVCGSPYGETRAPVASGVPGGASDEASTVLPPSLLLCRSCGFHFWQNSKPAVGALVTRTRNGRPEILLSRRGIEPYKGMWDFPGGFLSNGETPEDGLARELREELNVQVHRPRLFSLAIDEYPAEEVAEEARFVLSIFYRCEIEPDGKLTASDDVAEVRWFPLEHPPAQIAFRSNVQTLRDLLRALSEESGQRRPSG